MRSLCPLLLIIFSYNSFAQYYNLVPNPSFEELTFEAPNKQSIKAVDFDNLMEYWYSTNISPDILSDSIKTALPTYTNAKTGAVAVGLLNTMDIWTEYISVELDEPLQKGKTYYVEFWYMVIKPNRTSYSIDPNFGVLFNHGEKYNGIYYTKQTPQVPAHQSTDTTRYAWQKVSSIFIPEEAFSHITLGQFKPESYGRRRLNYYVAVDDIVVIESDPVIKMQAGETLILDDITFESGTATLQELAYPSLEKIYQSLLKNQAISLAIHGHTDDVGSDESNLTLSSNRAKTVYDYLIKRGIHKERLTFKGFGEKQPIESNDSPIGRTKNRRVEFKILDFGK